MRIADKDKTSTNMIIDTEQFYLNINFTVFTMLNFVCIDSGSQCTCIREYQVNLYSELMNEPLTTRITETVFKLGNRKHESLRALISRVSVSEYHFVDVKAKIFAVDKALILKLDVIKNLN